MKRRRLESYISLIFILFIIFIIYESPILQAENRSDRGIKKTAIQVLKKDSADRKITRVDNQKTSVKAQERFRSAGVEISGPVKDKAKLQLLKENKFLEQELSLAKNPQYYFVINLREKKIELRARGMVLKSWTARGMQYLGPAVPLEVTALQQKSALNPPKRLLINPAENQNKEESASGTVNNEQEKKKDEEKVQASASSSSGDNFEVPALEITDMPVSYELILNNGLQISIRTKGKEKTRQYREIISWYVLRPIKNLFSGQRKQNPHMVVYFEKEREAQGLYWAFIDGLKGIIWLP